MSIAFVFPGQGSHRPGALSAWTGHPAAAILEEVEAGVGRDVFALDEDATTGARTADAQPAILAASLVVWRALRDAGVTPAHVAGHSLGEYTATIAAGVLEITDGARLVATRGAAMGAACAAEPGTMAAVVKLTPDAVTVLVDEIDGLVVANDNAPGQVVVAGPPEAVEAVKDRARAAGGRAIPLDVEGAFHSPAMASAVPLVRDALHALDRHEPQVPLVGGASASLQASAEEVAAGLVEGILSPVRWREVQLRLAELGTTDLVEVGPGGVLAGLAKRTVPQLTVHTVATPADVDTLVDVLGQDGD